MIYIIYQYKIFSSLSAVYLRMACQLRQAAAKRAYMGRTIMGEGVSGGAAS